MRVIGGREVEGTALRTAFEENGGKRKAEIEARRTTRGERTTRTGREVNGY